MKVLFSIVVFIGLMVALGIATAIMWPREVIDTPHPDEDED